MASLMNNSQLNSQKFFLRKFKSVSAKYKYLIVGYLRNKQDFECSYHLSEWERLKLVFVIKIIKQSNKVSWTEILFPWWRFLGLDPVIYLDIWFSFELGRMNYFKWIFLLFFNIFLVFKLTYWNKWAHRKKTKKITKNQTQAEF